MAGRHRRPPAWRRILSSLLRSRNRVRTAALRAEIIALRATVAALTEELEALRAAAGAAGPGAVAAPAASAPPAPVTFELPLVRLALSDVAVDRGPDTALSEIVLTTSPVTAEGQAVALADLPERPLLDPALDRPAEPVDVAAAADATEASEGHVSTWDRRTA